jgi:hypothetical protein
MGLKCIQSLYNTATVNPQPESFGLRELICPAPGFAVPTG